MADALGAYGTSYELDVALKIDIDEMVKFLSPFDAPFLGTYNGLENAPVPSILPQGEVFEVQYDWLEDSLLTPRGTTDANHILADGTLSLTAGEGANFQVDDLVRVKADSGDYIQFHVTAVNYTTDDLTVAVWSGTDGAIASGALVEGVGTLPAEGSDPGEARATDRTRLHNFTQIFGPYPVEMSETEQVVAKYGVASEWQHQTAKRLKEAVIACEHALLYGTRKNDTSAKRRSMGGLDYWISAANGSTVDSVTTDISGAAGETAVLTLQQGCYNNGGDPRLIATGPDQKPNISDWRKSDIRFQTSERKRGQIVTSFETDFNIVDVLMHRWIRSSDLFLFNSEQAEVCTLRGRGWKWVNTAKTGDRDQAYVIAEKGFKFKGAAHAAKMDSLT